MKSISQIIKTIAGKITKSQLIRHITIVVLWDNIAKIMGIISTIILIRLLSKNDYALYTFFWSSATLFVGFISNGVDMAYIRVAAEEFSKRKKMAYDIFVYFIALSFGIFLILCPFVIFFGKPLSLLLFKSSLYDKPLLLGFIAAMGLFFINAASRYYQVQEKYKKAGLIMSFQKSTFVFLLLVALLLGKLNFPAAVCAQMTGLLIISVVVMSIIIKACLSTGRIKLSMWRFRIFFKASFWIILYFFCLSMFGQLDIFMISRFMERQDLANYGVAFKYYTLLMLLYPSIRAVLKVRTSKVDMVESLEKQKGFFFGWIKATSIICFPLGIVIIMFSGYVMNVLNGPRYTASILPFKVLAIAAMINYVFASASDIFRSMKKYFLLFCFGLMSVIINFMANLWLIPRYGINGAAVGTLITCVVVQIGAVIYIILKKEGNTER